MGSFSIKKIAYKLGVIMLLAINSTSFAETGINILAERLSGDELPNPGYEFVFHAQLINTNDAKIPVKALVALDGDMMTVFPKKATLNVDGRPEYTFVLPAPQNNISYEFFATINSNTSKEETIYSKKILIKRPCLAVQYSTTPIDSSLKGEDLLNGLLERSNGLDNEAELYKEATIITQRINSLLQDIVKQITKQKRLNEGDKSAH